ncbi:hypothetical protein FRC17_002646, partial [Serendipita sp. 399]
LWDPPFINAAIDGHGGEIRDRLRCCTTATQLVKVEGLSSDGRPVVFVDVLGFGSPGKTNSEIVVEAGNFLLKAYGGSVPIDSILYLHRINDNRASITVSNELELFKASLHQQDTPRTVFVTTMWNFGIGAREENREKELRGKIGQNIGIERFMNTPKSAQKIASGMDAGWSRSVDASITTGFVDERKRLVPGNSAVSRGEKRGVRSQRDTPQRDNLATMREGGDDTTPAYDISQRGGWLCFP